MARTKGSKNTVHSKKAAVDYAAIVEEKAAAKKQIESEIEGLSENIGTLKEQLKRKKAELKTASKELAKAETKKAEEAKAAEEAKKAAAEDVLKRLLASGVTAEEIIAKLQ